MEKIRRSAIDRVVEELAAEGKISVVHVNDQIPERYIISIKECDALLTIDLEKRLLIHENGGILPIETYTPMAEIRSIILRYIRYKREDLDREWKQRMEDAQGGLGI